MIDFGLTESQQVLRNHVETFVRDEVIPMEEGLGAGEVDDALRRALTTRAAAAGLLTMQAPEAYGGRALSHLDCAAVFTAAGYSLLGPIALNCAAPDEGNMHLLSRVASESQKERWLRPMVEGKIRSCFAMTEPSPGAGSDPALLGTTVRRDGDDWVVNGKKWLITGAEGAGFTIVMAKHEQADGDVGAGEATLLMADMDTPGIEIERRIATTDRTYPGGHSVVSFNDVRIPGVDVLGEAGRGFKYAQVRLAPARLTHCMRWLGAATRTHDIAKAYARDRQAFGQRLIDHEGVSFMLADNEIELRQCQLSIWHTAWLLDQGEHAGRESSMTKVFCSEALCRVADRSQQILGGMGVTHDTVVAQIATEIRAFRIYDGPSEVHRFAIGRRLGR